MEYKANISGFHTSLTPEVHEEIINAIPEVITPTQCAHRARISPQNLSNWLKKGLNDLNDGIVSPFAHLFVDFHYYRTFIVADAFFKIRNGADNFKAHCWLLEKCLREEFGKESEEVKELKVLLEYILKQQGMNQDAIKEIIKQEGIHGERESRDGSR